MSPKEKTTNIMEEIKKSSARYEKIRKTDKKETEAWKALQEDQLAVSL